MNWQDRQVDYKAKCIESLQRILPSKDDCEDKERYNTLIKNLDKRLHHSGHDTPKNNIMSIILKEIENLNK